MPSKCIFVTSLPPKYSEIINNCLVSWGKYKKDIILIQNKNEIDDILNIYPGHNFKIIESKTPIDPLSEWSKPYLPNIIDFINLTEFYDVFIINSDIYLNYSPEEFEEKWMLNNNKSFICGIRTNYDEEGQELLYFDPYGIDIFKLPKGTYKYFKNTFLPYLIGMPAWDWWLLCKLIEFEFELKVEKFNFNILHQIHHLNWKSEDYDYGVKLLGNSFFKKKYGITEGHQWANFVQILTGRLNWNNYNCSKKTYEFLKVANITRPFKTVFVLYSMLGSLSNLLIKNLVNIISKIDKEYININLLNKLSCVYFLSDLASLISGGESNNDSSFNLFYFRDPNDVLVSRYLDFIQNPNMYSPIEKILNHGRSISEYKNKMSNLTIDEFVLQEVLSLKENLNKFIEKSNNSDFSFKILYYEDIIDKKIELCMSFYRLFSKLYNLEPDFLLEDIFDSFIWISDEDKKDSMEVGYHKKVLQKETVEILNKHFKEINDFFYEKKQNSNFLPYS